MARNGVASNLLLFFVVVAGLASAGSLVQEVFPEFSLDTILVSVAYPGATPEEVEESIVRKIEEQIKAVEGIKEITATASEGVANVSVELKLGTDLADQHVGQNRQGVPTFHNARYRLQRRQHFVLGGLENDHARAFRGLSLEVDGQDGPCTT